MFKEFSFFIFFIQKLFDVFTKINKSTFTRTICSTKKKKNIYETSASDLYSYSQMLKVILKVW